MSPLQLLMFVLSHDGHAVAVTNITKFGVCDGAVVVWSERRMT
jgi:hypothetical protein